MDTILNIINQFSDFIWTYPMPVLLVSLGIWLTIKFRFKYQLNFRFNIKNTYGGLFKKKNAGEQIQGAGSVSSFAAACTALANTVGIGSIGGVATAITMGGPGAIFWLWFSAFFGIATKACEIILGQRYRVKYEKSMDEYVCDRSFVMEHALGWKKGAVALSVCCFMLGPWTCLVQSESATSSIEEAFNVDRYLTLLVMVIFIASVIIGGLKGISSKMESVVPKLAITYLTVAVILLVMNYDQILPAFALIFKSAFSPAAGVGGFAGATVMEAIRFGIARGIYSNDAGTGYGIVAHAAATTDHPIRQSSWGFGEVFLTIIICTVTALAILTTNVWVDYAGITSSRLTTLAFKVTYGDAGSWFMAIFITLLACTTTIGMYFTCEKAVNFFFGDTRANKIAKNLYRVYYLAPIVLFTNLQADILWALTDILSAVYVLITMTLILSRRKEIFRLFNDFWDRYIPAKNAGQDVPPVTYCKRIE